MIASQGSHARAFSEHASPGPAQQKWVAESSYALNDPGVSSPELAKDRVLLQIGRVPAFSWGMMVALPVCMLIVYTVEL